MSMQNFYSRLSTEPRRSVIGSLVTLTRVGLSHVKVLADGWWDW
jgi:hypothetical protein